MAAIADGDRIGPIELDRVEVLHGEASAKLIQPVEDLLAERAAIEQARPFGRQRLERAREIGLLQHEACGDRALACGIDA